MGHDNVFDFYGRNVHATRSDDVFQTVGHINISVLVYGSTITSVVPAILKNLLNLSRAVPKLVDHALCSHNHFPDFSLREVYGRLRPRRGCPPASPPFRKMLAAGVESHAARLAIHQVCIFRKKVGRKAARLESAVDTKKIAPEPLKRS